MLERPYHRALKFWKTLASPRLRGGARMCKTVRAQRVAVVVGGATAFSMCATSLHIKAEGHGTSDNERVQGHILPEQANGPFFHRNAELPLPNAVLNLREIEDLAKNVLSPVAWAYYRGASDDENSYRENSAAFRRFWFRPRVLNKVSQVTTKTNMLSMPSSLPIFIAPAALAKLGHPDGELNLVRAAGKEGILQCVSSNASCSLEEITSARLPEQKLFFQLYLHKDRTVSEALIKRVEKENFKALILTVDAATPGKRELDQRTQIGNFSGPAHGESGTNGLGVSQAISGWQDPDVCWADISWMQSLTHLPIVLKGLSRVEDVEKAFQHGVKAVILSNHGGRELDFAPAPMTVLYELYQQRPDLLRDHEVYIDGGITRGTDVLKALCLGARGVGLGRAFMYANGVWGEAGCRRVIEIMREEIETGMRLLGVTSIEQLTPELIRYVDRGYDTCWANTRGGRS